MGLRLILHPGGGRPVERGTERSLRPCRAAAEARQPMRHADACLPLEDDRPGLNDLRAVKSCSEAWGISGLAKHAHESAD